MPETSSPQEEARRAQERERQLTVLHGIAQQETTRLYSGRSPWTWWLELAARHGRHGFTNTLLINAQMPTATDARSYRQWQAQGRQVKQGATGIRIISPRGTPRSVFDASQTTGPPPTGTRTFSPAEAWDRLHRLAADQGFQIDRAGRWTYTGPPGRLIQIAPAPNEQDAVTALAHQLGHVYLHAGRIDQAGDERWSCHGAQRVEADSIAYLLLVRLGMNPMGLTFPAVTRWAGTDPRANPLAAVRALADRVLRADARLQRHLSALPPPAAQQDDNDPKADALPLPHAPQPQPPRTADQRKPTRGLVPAIPASLDELEEIHRAAHHLFTSLRSNSWVPTYLNDRGFDEDTQQQWGIGHAPKAWRVLTDHLRHLSHTDEAILTSGLARRARSGRLYDTFRDRAMLPIRRPDGTIAGFIGRLPDGAEGPKYLNSPESPIFRKGELLFGLHEIRNRMVTGARPVLVEGPLDAMAVNTAAPQHYAAVAPSGTALTTAQLHALDRIADLSNSGLIIALDGDPAGRAATERAWSVLSQVTGPVEAAILPGGQDPADILRHQGPAALHEALQRTTPLADIAIDAAVRRAGHSLQAHEDRIAAIRAAAPLVAQLPPRQVAHQVVRMARALGTDPAIVTEALTETVAPADARHLAADDFPLSPLAPTRPATQGNTTSRPNRPPTKHPKHL
ncbi:Toprim-like [Thermomonospora echinospora]|uniref:Toprim-like n=1 Tax=Thermomonospora echinospora TaxID=1992 RepID=A0A1H5UUJ6_9ACTN|nr:toprim domain-containing protein [Thermomonospora echinospora]SEF78151.1 Toprim-like [Thermomonospora echinospora]